MAEKLRHTIPMIKARYGRMGFLAGMWIMDYSYGVWSLFAGKPFYHGTDLHPPNEAIDSYPTFRILPGNAVIL
jgi:hypothetical protein